MQRAINVKPRGTWQETPYATVTLPFDERHRRRICMTDDKGEDFMLDLANAVLLGDGDALELEDGGVIAVKAAAEPVADIQCVDAEMAARIAWHIGNRHTPLQVLAAGRLRICNDHVLVSMVEVLGAHVVCSMAPFAPEGGAYASDTHEHRHHCE